MFFESFSSARRRQSPDPDVSRPRDEGPDAEMLWDTLRTIIDPEIGLDIVTLGMVYGLECAGSTVRVRFTLTTPACPLGDVITAGIEGALMSLPGVEHVETDLVWEPAWHPGMITEEL